MRTVAVVVLALLFAGGCTATQPAPVERFTIAAGPDRGVYFELGQALAAEARQRWSVQADVLQTVDSVDNLRRLDSGEAVAAFSTLDVSMMALHGNVPFHAALRVSAVAGIYVDYLHLVVPLHGGINELSDLADRSVATGPQGSGLDIVSSRVLALVPGVKKQELPPEEAAGALRRGQIDAFFALGGMPSRVVSELAEQMPILLLPLDGEYPRLRSEFGETYLLRPIPRGVYRLPAGLTAPGAIAPPPIMTLGVPNALVVRADLPERTAYRLTELLFAAKPRLAEAYREARHLDHRSALATFPVPLHPGAESFYHDAKPMALAALSAGCASDPPRADTALGRASGALWSDDLVG